MQTFLPRKSMVDTMRCLDSLRLGKQRLEVLHIMRVLHGETTGYQHHPAVKMWAGYEGALLWYGRAACAEWVRRGGVDAIGARLMADYPYPRDSPFPPWWGNKAMMETHRSNLVRKAPDYYDQHFPRVRANLAYLWPRLLPNGGYVLGVSKADARRIAIGERVNPL